MWQEISYPVLCCSLLFDLYYNKIVTIDWSNITVTELPGETDSYLENGKKYHITIA